MGRNRIWIGGWFGLLPVLLLALSACSTGTAQTPLSDGDTPTTPAASIPTGTSEGGSEAPGGGSGDPSSGEVIRLVVAGEGNETRYLVREQLANLSFPSDAIGVTQSVTGGIVILADGSVLADQSGFTVDLTTLRSDSSRRDGFIQRSTLETDSFPSAVFIPSEAPGLPVPLPTSGALSFQLVGELTIHGVTRPSTWEVNAEVQGQTLIGRAATHFTFAEFGMVQPRVAVVLSVEDDIRLEYDFRLVQEEGAAP